MSRRYIYFGSFASATWFSDDFGMPSTAYSLRKLTPLSSNCIRVRRSSDNTEQNIGFISNTPNASIDTTSLLSFVGAGDGYIVTWYDQSTNARDLTQSTITNQPNIVSGGVLRELNSKPSIFFDGNDRLITAFSLQNQPNTIYSLANATDVSATRILYDDNDNVNYRNILQMNSTDTAIFAGTLLNVNTGWALNAQYLHTALYNGTSSLFRRNGVLFGSGNAGNQPLEGLTIGSRFSASNFWIGNVQEFIFYNADKTSDFATSETNIDNYYNVF
jgi:hypothetical protein